MVSHSDSSTIIEAIQRLKSENETLRAKLEAERMWHEACQAGLARRLEHVEKLRAALRFCRPALLDNFYSEDGGPPDLVAAIDEVLESTATGISI